MGNLSLYKGIRQLSHDPNYVVTFQERAGIDDASGAVLDAWAFRMLGVVRESHEVLRAYGQGMEALYETDEAFRARMRRMLISQWRVFADREVLAMGEADFHKIASRQRSLTEAEILGEVAKCRPLLNVILTKEMAIGWRRQSPEGDLVTIGPRQWIVDCVKSGEKSINVFSLIYAWTHNGPTTEVYGHAAEWYDVRLKAAQGALRSDSDSLLELAKVLPCVLCGDHFAPLDRLQPFQFCLQCGGDLYFVGEDLAKTEAKHAEKRGIQLERYKIDRSEKKSP